MYRLSVRGAGGLEPVPADIGLVAEYTLDKSAVQQGLVIHFIYKCENSVQNRLFPLQWLQSLDLPDKMESIHVVLMQTHAM